MGKDNQTNIEKICSFKDLEKKIISLGKSGTRARIVCAVPEEEPALLALKRVNELEIVEPILVGNVDQIKDLMQKLEMDYNRYEVVDEKDPIEACKKASLMVRNKSANLLMKGLVSTSIILHAAMDKETGFRSPDALMSHVGIMQVEGYDRFIYITDAGLNIDPSLQEKKSIIDNAIRVAHSLGNPNPKVALLSAVETINLKMSTSTDDAILAKMSERNQIKGGIIDGPLALDIAINKHAAEHKGVKSPIQGDADILVVDNIDVGNVLLKSIIYFAKSTWAGIVVGAKNPIVLTSRSDSDESKYLSILLAIMVDYNSRKMSLE